MRLPRALAATAVLAALLTALTGPAPAAAATTTDTITLPVRDALAQLPLRSEDRTGYERSKFKHWIDADKDDSMAWTQPRREPRWASLRCERSRWPPVLGELGDRFTLEVQQRVQRDIRARHRVLELSGSAALLSAQHTHVVDAQHTGGTAHRPAGPAGMVDQLQQPGLDLCVGPRRDRAGAQAHRAFP
ncbi:hypothetical protein [Streptomyces sp. L2]|uniref:hypothetical protein n=1 Tax=Streptomyces sp. L2 TaxID=2162665 RepID=UPI001F514E70|nr:hypothetical protein [Streptomyces sp. L2]